MSDYVKDILLVGAGYMAREYAKVLKALGYQFQVVGRSDDSAKSFEEETGHTVIRGGIEEYLKSVSDKVPEYCIVAVQVEHLAEVCKLLLSHGSRHILLEKPGSLNVDDFEMLADLAAAKQAEISIAYNRRFYAAVFEAEKIIAEDGGVTSFHFEFTEWLHKFPWFEKNSNSAWKVFAGNSTHVIDLAFFLGGSPKDMSSYGRASIEGNNCCTTFSGAGRTKQGALFSYQADWEAPGRWSVEVLTHRHRLIFRPMEKLQVQNLKSVQIEPVEIDYNLDVAYKPGLYLETKAFIEHNNNFHRLCSLEEQMEKMHIYCKMIEL